MRYCINNLLNEKLAKTIIYFLKFSFISYIKFIYVITTTEGLNDEHRIQHENECEKILEQTSNQSNTDSND